jgi:hypothetical protein
VKQGPGSHDLMASTTSSASSSQNPMFSSP